VSADKAVKVWTVSPGEGKEREGEEEEGCGSVMLPPDIKILATFASHTGTVRCVRYHPQGSLVVTSSHDKELRVWDTRVPNASKDVSFHSQAVTCVSGSPSDAAVSYAATASLDNTVKVWNYKTADFCFAVEPRHTQRINAVCMSPDATYFITGSQDGTIKKWGIAGWESTRTAEMMGQAKAHRGGVCLLVAHPTGNFFISCGSGDGRIVIWESEAFTDIVSHPPHTHPQGTAVVAHVHANTCVAIFSKTLCLKHDAMYVRYIHKLQPRAHGISINSCHVLEVHPFDACMVWHTNHPHADYRSGVIQRPSRGEGFGSPVLNRRQVCHYRGRQGQHSPVAHRGSEAGYLWAWL
jgi:WD40 repeat protein